MVAVVLFAGFVLVLGRGAGWLDGSALRGLTAGQRASEIDTMRGYLIQVGAGVLAAGALLYTALNFHLAREGHVTDRFTKAIEQLGSERLDVRLGAIYALERIMIDSSRDHPTIVEVLAAFVREHAPIAAPGQDPDRWSWTSLTRRARGGGSLKRYSSWYPSWYPSPAKDVQAALTVLARRPAGRSARGRVNPNDVERGRLNLSGANLTGASLYSANLAGASLSDADLTHTNLYSANLSGADLSDANLTGARLDFADLTGARLTRTNLSGADLSDANLTGVTLTDKQQSDARALPGGGS